MIRVFRHYVPGTYFLLGLVEFLILYASVYLGVELSLYTSTVFGFNHYHEVVWYRSLLYAFVMSGAMMVMGLYWRHSNESMAWDYIFRIIASFLIGIILMSFLFFIFPILETGREEVAFALIISLLSISIVRYSHYHLSDHEITKRRILVLGAGKQASLMEKLLRKSDQYGFKIVGYIHLHGEVDVINPYKILPSIRSLKSAVEEYEIDEIVVALDDRRKNFPVDEILDCKMEGIVVHEIGVFMEKQTEKIRLDILHPSSIIFSDGFNRAIISIYRKKLFDIGSSIMLLLILWPVMLITLIAIYIESGGKGSVFYRQERVGKNGKCFELLKFRSMHLDAEKDGKAQWATQNDSRVTRVGRIIRLLRIDEMPQLFNVLKGDMSFVGPRPERPQFVEELSNVIPFYGLRHKVNPGITGWAQISYPYGSTKQDAIEKLQYDLYYIKHYSLTFDFMILFQTAQAILWGKGAR